MIVAQRLFAYDDTPVSCRGIFIFHAVCLFVLIYHGFCVMITQ